MTGILALWNDCRAGDEAAYEAWYRDEHLPERLGVPAFQRGRRFRTLDGKHEYFTYYEVDGPEVLTAPGYLARLDDPTPMTRHMMTHVFQSMSRTICRVEARAGHLYGSVAVTAALDAPPAGALNMIATQPGVAQVQYWAAAGDPRDQSEEERLRGGDDRIDHCLLVETLDVVAAREVAARLSSDYGLAPSGIYQLMCEMVAPGV